MTRPPVLHASPLQAGTCPLCRQQFGPRNDIYSANDYENWFRLREPYEAIAEITPIYLASNPKKHTFGEFVLWLFASQSDYPDTFQTRAQLVMDRFQGFTMAILEALRHGPTGRRLLMRFRVGNADTAPLQDNGTEDEVRHNQRDIREENFENPDDEGTVSERYSSNGEEHMPTDDDREESMENENVDTAGSTSGEVEDIMDEREDGEKDLMDEDEDADPASVALGEGEGEEEDSTDEGEDLDEMVDDEDDWESELEDFEQHTFLAVLGCAVVVSMVGMGLFLNL